ncbi:hypothetical protein Aca07nite_62950 [Actinoplanes capillaceus]|uniref:CBM2 domain-containing protein n=1 Tax=Actinoplanes campanulatus TaxID=113559 RepID=A0ABQ3WS78_9ACTN|nr:cellulose-binding domain-containing protein [Actinoplanes capillaceus]GID49020.1 hypothetical protein Aca07nite_62950 [Actinoplanes capillaceus]
MQIGSPYTQGCPGPTTAKQHSGDVWYVEVDCTGYTIAPAGQSAHRMEVQLKIGVAEGGVWDPADDPSYQASAGPNTGVPLFDGSALVWGAVPDGTNPSPSPSVSTSVSPSASPSASPSVSPSVPPAGCRIAYSTNDWSSGFTATVTITNGSTAVNGWTLAFPYTAGQKVSQAWSATVIQSGTQVTATNTSWNGSLPAGGTVSFGFNATHTGSNPPPTTFTLNGTACTTT